MQVSRRGHPALPLILCLSPKLCPEFGRDQLIHGKKKKTKLPEAEFKRVRVGTVEKRKTFWRFHSQDVVPWVTVIHPQTVSPGYSSGMFLGSLLMLSSHITLAGRTAAYPLQLVRCYFLAANHLALVTRAFIASSETKSSCYSWFRRFQWWGNPSFAAACLPGDMTCSQSACAKYADQLNDIELNLGPSSASPQSGLILRRLADNYQGGQRLSLKQQQNLPRAFPRAGLRMQNKLCKKLKAITSLATFQSSSSLTKLPSHCCFSEKIPSAK